DGSGTAGVQATGALQQGPIYIAKLTPGGNGLSYAAQIGGPNMGTNAAFVWDLAIDGAGNAYITGATHDSGFATTAGAYDTTFGQPGGSHADAFVTKVDPTGNSLVYSTLLGTILDDVGYGIDV